MKNYRTLAIKSYLYISFIISFALLIILAGCKKAEQLTSQMPVTVSAYKVIEREIPMNIQFVGQTTSENLVEIRSRVSGHLKKRHFREGELVQYNDLLLEIDAQPFSLAVESARVALLKQEAILLGAESDLERVRVLSGSNAVSKRDLDAAVVRARTAAADVASAKTELESARLNLEYASIRSPLTGIISRAYIQEGTFVTTAAGQDGLLATITPIDPIRVNFSVADIQELNFQNELKNKTIVLPQGEASRFELILPNGQSYQHKGELSFKDPIINTATGTFTVTGRIANPEGQLVPGQFVRVKVLDINRRQAITVAQKAVLQGIQGKYVFVIDGDTARVNPVEVGEWIGEDYLIVSGLKPGQLVVIEGVEKLRSGQKVVLKTSSDIAENHSGVQP